MKKNIFISIILLFALLIGASVPVFADSQEVTGTYLPGNGSEVISFDVFWGAMSFTYSPEVKIWDPDSHNYDIIANAEWIPNGNTVTVTNHSNVDVNVSFAFKSVNALSTIVGSTFTYDKDGVNPNASVKLKAGEVGKVNEADKVTATLQLHGSLPEDHQEGAKIGTVSVMISKAS